MQLPSPYRISELGHDWKQSGCSKRDRRAVHVLHKNTQIKGPLDATSGSPLNQMQFTSLQVNQSTCMRYERVYTHKRYILVLQWTNGAKTSQFMSYKAWISIFPAL